VAKLQTLDKTFPALMLQLYRQWYGLPRKSTRLWLNRARFQIAEQLLLDESVEILRQFVSDATERPGVAQMSTGFLQDVRTSLRNEQLSRIDRDQASELYTLLTVEHPPEFALAKWIYVSSRAEATIAQVRARLEPTVMERLPDQTRHTVEEIFAKLDAALAESEPTENALVNRLTGPRLQATGEALVALEQTPGLLRIIWRELLSGKAETERKVLGIGGHRTPRREASSLLDARVTAADERGITQPFHTDIVFPARVRQGDEAPLTVRLTLNPVKESSVTEIVSISFLDPTKPELLDVVVDASGFTERFDLWHRTMVVYSDRDSQPVTFLLKAEATTASRDEPLPRTITISFYHAGKHIGKANFDTTIIRQGQTSAQNVRLDDAEAGIELRLDRLPPPADLEIRVTHDPAAQQLHFMLHSTRSDVGYHWRRMGSVPLLEGKPQVYFQRTISEISESARYLSDDLLDDEKADFDAKIALTGEQLFEKLFSSELQSEYWNNIRRKRDQGKIQSVLITTDEPWVPWELVKPYHYDEDTDEETSDEFLAGSFQITRWLTGHGPYERVTIDSVGMVVPDLDLLHTTGEGAYLESLRDQGVTVTKPLRTKMAVIEQIRKADIRLLHVASHAAFDTENPNASPIMLDDADLLPTDLNRHVIRDWRKTRPVVFLNACQTGRIEYELNGLGGWADKFIQEVRATAFLGTLWEVNDALAAEFTRVLYDELLAGQTLGVACRTARLHIRELAPSNPTWLAYTLYGDPNTLVDWGTGDGGLGPGE
jgi:hypothetical protein